MGSSTMKTGQVNIIQRLLQNTTKETSSRVTSSLNLCNSFVYILSTPTKVDTIYHHIIIIQRIPESEDQETKCSLQVRVLMTGKTLASLHCSCLNHTQSAVKYRIQFLELLVFLTFTVQVFTENIKSKKEKGKRLKPKSKY